MSNKRTPYSRRQRRHRFFTKLRQFLRFFVRVVLHASGLPLTLLFGLLPLLLAMAGLLDSSLSIEWWLAIAVTGLVLAGVIGFWLALKALPPSTYAELLISGRPENEIFTTIAHKARRICHKFTLSTQPTSALSEELLDAACQWLKTTDSPPRLHFDLDAQTAPLVADALRKAWRCHKPLEVHNAIDEIRFLLETQNSLLRRVEAAKHRAAIELGIHQRRLCDHIFQFSPAMYYEGVTKYLQIWEELEKTIESIHHPGEVSRFCRQVVQIRLIEKDIRWRETQLAQLEAFKNLHTYVGAIASIHSSSGSLRAYLWGLHAAVSAVVGDECAGSGREKILERAQKQLRFLYRKRRAHTGFDLHTLALQLCRKLMNDLSEEPDQEPHEVLTQEVIRSVVSVLKAIEEEPPEPAPHLPAVLADASMRLRIQHLRHLPLIFSQVMARSREKMARTFDDRLKDWQNSVEGTTFIVTYGYSKMVRDLIGRSILATDPNAAAKLKLFLLVTGEEDEEFDARKMKLELRRQVSRSGLQVAAGNPDLLVGLVDEKDGVLFLVGAECFDSEDRIVHPRTTMEHIREVNRDLVTRENPPKTSMIVAAESYKQLSDPLRESGFYSDVFERVAVYGRDDDELLKVVIMTDDEANTDENTEAETPP